MQTTLVAGVDEVGRGPLAGPVVAAAVILNPEKPIDGLRDSKKLSEKARLRLFDEIQQNAIAYSIGYASVEEIDDINILQATMLAMQRAVENLPIAAESALVDGNRLPPLGIPGQAIIGGDDKVPAIAAASIIAKVTRDRWMAELDDIHPGYGFAIHKGYGTRAHMSALQSLGPCPYHRQSFAPIKALLTTEGST